MSVAGIVVILALAAGATLVLSTLTYALRDFTRLRLEDYLERHSKSQWFDATVEHIDDLILVTAFFRMIVNTVLALASLALAGRWTPGYGVWAYSLAAGLACVVTFFCSVAFPHSLAAHAAAEVVGLFVRPLHALRLIFMPVMGLMRGIDNLVRNATGNDGIPEAAEIEQEILSVVEEGEKEGVVDEQAREMIESVIEFRDTTAAQIMTPRRQVVAIEAGATLEEVKHTIQESGHSRIPIYSGTLDQVVGVLYARDLLRYLGESVPAFDVKSAMHPPFFAPETKPLRDLFRDFRMQKIHIAIVLDEYGGTAGVVTIEDVLKELVGDISDKQTSIEPALFRRIDDAIVEADAAIDVNEINRLTGLNIPEDAGYTTLGGFVSTTMGRIPEPGAVIEFGGYKFTVLDAEPQKINRLRVEQMPEPATVSAEGPGVAS